MPRIAAAERRALLLDAAWRVLLDHGVAGATTRAICAEAGMPQGSFHYCFDSRNELLTELTADLLPRELSAAAAAVGRGGSLVDTVHRALLAYWELVESEPQVHQVVYEITAMSLREPALADPAKVRYAAYPRAVTGVLEEIATVRGIAWDRPVDVLARQVVALLDGLTLQFLIDGDATGARAALRACAEDIARHRRRVRYAAARANVGDGSVVAP